MAKLLDSTVRTQYMSLFAAMDQSGRRAVIEALETIDAIQTARELQPASNGNGKEAPTQQQLADVPP